MGTPLGQTDTNSDENITLPQLRWGGGSKCSGNVLFKLGSIQFKRVVVFSNIAIEMDVIEIDPELSEVSIAH